MKKCLQHGKILSLILIVIFSVATIFLFFLPAISNSIRIEDTFFIAISALLMVCLCVGMYISYEEDLEMYDELYDR